MVAYSFQRRFAEPILEGRKGGTIRPDRRRHARPGEELQLYVGMRTKQCRLIARKTCVAVSPILLDLAFRSVVWPGCRGLIHCAADLDAFARFDGFQNFDEMTEFWRQTHAVELFTGWHIRWLPLPSN
jgi:hypothetical protein